MKYLFFLIFSLNIIFYIFLIYKPLNIESDFSIDAGNNLSEIFKNLEEKNILFPKSIKLIFNVSGIDKKIYLGKYKIYHSDSLIDIFQKIYFGQIILKKFIVSDGSSTLHVWELTERRTFTFIETGAISTFEFQRVDKFKVYENRNGPMASNWTQVRKLNELEWDPYSYGGNTILANISTLS